MKKILFIIFAVFLFVNLSFAQTTKLFQTMINCNNLIEVGDEIWFATRLGVTRMNKTTLERTVYTMHNSGLPSEDIKEIVIDNQGNIWVGTYDLLLTMWTGDDWNHVTTINFPDSIKVTTQENAELYSITFDQDDNMWIGTNNGLCKFDGTNWEYFNYKNTDQPFLSFCWDVEIDTDNNVLVAGFELFKYDGLTWLNYTDSDSSLVSYIDPELFKANDGSIWFTNKGDQFAKLVNDNWIKFNETTTGDVPNGISFIRTENDTPKLLNTDGIYTLENGLWNLETDSQFEELEGHKDYYHIDQDGNRWLGRHSRLIKAIGNDLTKTHINNVPLMSNHAHHFLEDQLGNMYIINGSRYIAKYNLVDGLTEVFPESNPAFSFFPVYYHMSLAPNNDLWFSSNHGLTRYDGLHWEFFTTANSDVPSDFIYETTFTSNGDMWAASDDGLFFHDGNTWEVFNTSNSILKSNNISEMVLDQNDVLWLRTFYNPPGPGTKYEIYKIENGVWSYFDPTNSVLPDGNPISDLYVDDNNNLWVSCIYGQVFKYDGNDWNNIEEFNSDQKRVVSIAGGNGKIYCSVRDQGIAILENGDWTYINTSNSELIKDYNLNLKTDAEGSLWMAPNSRGVQVYNADGFITSVEFPKGEKNNLDISASPNPVQNLMTIKINNNALTKNNTLEIFNNKGQLIQHLKIGELLLGNQTINVNVSSLSPGIYFAKLKNKKQSGVLKFTKL